MTKTMTKTLTTTPAATMTASPLRIRLTIAAAAAVVLAAGAHAAERSTLSGGDTKFVKEAAMGGATEVEASKSAQQKAANDAVKQFAGKMVDDHTKAGDELKQLASSKGVDAPSMPPKDKQKAIEKMNAMSGNDFDRDYMKHMVADHKKTVALFEKEARSGKDADLKAWAAKTLPTLQQHMQMAQQVNDGVKNAK